MPRMALRLFVGGILLACGGALMAQTILDRVEDALRRRTLRPNAADAPIESGYLGVIADDSPSRGQGLDIVEIIPGGPADNAGLKTHDLITAIDGRGVRRMDDMAREMNGRAAGSQVEFEVIRDGRTHRIAVVLGHRAVDRDPQPSIAGLPRDATSGPSARGNSPAGPRLGIRTAPLSELDRQTLSLSDTRGAKVVAITVGSAADRASLAVGDIITALDGQTINGPDDISKAMQQMRPGGEVDVTLIRDGEELVKRVALAMAATRGPALGAGPRPADAEPSDFVPKSSPDRIEALERRVRELEARLEKLESAAHRAAR